MGPDEAGGDQVAEALSGMASTDAGTAAAAEERARKLLVANIAALPPRAVVSSGALRAFRQQHVAMMKYIEGTSGGAVQLALPST